MDYSLFKMDGKNIFYYGISSTEELYADLGNNRLTQYAPPIEDSTDDETEDPENKYDELVIEKVKGFFSIQYNYKENILYGIKSTGELFANFGDGKLTQYGGYISDN